MGRELTPEWVPQQSYGTIGNQCFCLGVSKYFFNNYILLVRAAYKAAETFLFLSPSFLLILMGNLLYVIAVICIIIWALGFFGVIGGLGNNSLIHILLVIAVIAILFRVISGRNAV